ncbi:serine hydrolase domain-containing protein [Erythrobacter rubeus]|uniref:Serine hydrolase n=1 Tax=Erythrobacter rubeus TaxID=2760803 RepID=A0ABR8KR87_9SPHN|nr:serine hydrolase [Erythrobacter rubeus]MBD2843264.1 serine hydrolase [Erythrobacter rubeus]
MTFRTASLIATAALLPPLASCGSAPPPAPPPLSDEALQAVMADAGAPKDQLARQIDELFTQAELGETRAIVLMSDGELAAERYSEGYDQDTRFVSWSMAKTVTAVLIGMLVADGKLNVGDPAPVPMWQRPGDPRAEITLRHLLQMRSGLRHTEAGDPPYDSSEVRMLFLDGRDDMARWAKEQPLEAEPGEQFEYSSNTTVILADIGARALTSSSDPAARRQAVDEFLKERLFEPLGMDSMVLEYDASGTLIGGSLMHATARDWAKFGEFLRRGGRSAEGQQLVPSRWIDAMTTPSPASGFYGYQTWLNRESGIDRDEDIPDRGPETMFAAIGHMGQYVLISPEQRITLVRLGHSNRTERFKMLAELFDIAELYPTR